MSIPQAPTIQDSSGFPTHEQETLSLSTQADWGWEQAVTCLRTQREPATCRPLSWYHSPTPHISPPKWNPTGCPWLLWGAEHCSRSRGFRENPKRQLQASCGGRVRAKWVTASKAETVSPQTCRHSLALPQLTDPLRNEHEGQRPAGWPVSLS